MMMMMMMISMVVFSFSIHAVEEITSGLKEEFFSFPPKKNRRSLNNAPAS